jgi:hypothetical protein
MCVTGALVREFVSLIVMYVHLYILRLAAELLYHHASTVQVDLHLCAGASTACVFLDHVHPRYSSEFDGDRQKSNYQVRKPSLRADKEAPNHDGEGHVYSPCDTKTRC